MLLDSLGNHKVCHRVIVIAVIAYSITFKTTANLCPRIWTRTVGNCPEIHWYLQIQQLFYIYADSKHELFVSDDQKLLIDQMSSFCIHVNSVSVANPLKVTLVWTDYPGSLLSRMPLVNDLDLYIV